MQQLSLLQYFFYCSLIFNKLTLLLVCLSEWKIQYTYIRKWNKLNLTYKIDSNNLFIEYTYISPPTIYTCIEKYEIFPEITCLLFYGSKYFKWNCVVCLVSVAIPFPILLLLTSTVSSLRNCSEFQSHSQKSIVLTNYWMTAKNTYFTLKNFIGFQYIFYCLKFSFLWVSLNKLSENENYYPFLLSYPLSNYLWVFLLLLIFSKGVILYVKSFLFHMTKTFFRILDTLSVPENSVLLLSPTCCPQQDSHRRYFVGSGYP